jgi:hypothetical protein
MPKLTRGDRVRLKGSSVLYQVDDIVELADGGVCYWIFQQDEIPTRIFAKENDVSPASGEP